MKHVKSFEQVNERALNESALSGYCVLPGIDLVLEDDLLEVLEIWGKKGIAVQILEASGPGGGNPMASVFGEYKDLVKWIKEFYSTGDKDADQEYIDSIEKV
jgi:hypothetical protein